MREILFRGKETNKDKWIYGVPVKGTAIDESETLIIESVFECDEYCCRGCDFAPIISSSIGQFTGLTDKNGTKIFEGDIIQYYGTYPLEVFTEEGHTKIRWFDSVTKSKCSELFFGGNDEAYGEFEVIGNIHDNPELLEV